VDCRADERARQELHGLVNADGWRSPRRSARPTAPAGASAVARPLLIGLVAVALVAGVAGGLLRAGVVLPSTQGAEWLGRAALDHAALMIGAFLGTVVGVERAVALKLRAAFAAPFASAFGGVCLLLGFDAAGASLGVVAAAAFSLASAVVVSRQRAPHTVLLLVGALAWLVGNVLFAAARSSAAVLPWWFAFLLLTIAAERLEMTRLMRRRPEAEVSLVFVLALLLAGAAASSAAIAHAGVLFGAALTLLALWLAVYDIARRTVHAEGLARYMAVCLLAGYAWLGVAGVAWAATDLGLPLRDTALHALGLGFIVSMMMAHAPVILPAVARIKLHFGGWFYLPLALLHGSLLVRLAGGYADPRWRADGAALNALALALFGVVVVGSAVAAQRRGSSAVASN